MSFIVIEGLDGSGKSTQLRLLNQYIEERKIPYKYLHFPRVEQGVYGDLVARFLRGDLGDIKIVNPYLVALIYAGDRNDAASEINKWINDGYLVIVDRYVYSNIAFQCAKIEPAEEKGKLADWILNLEFNYNKIPKPDVSLFLDVPFEFTKKKLSQQRKGDDRSYLKGKEDIHEASIDFQQKVKDVYLWQVENNSDFDIISCYGYSNEMLTKEEIFAKILEKINFIFKI